MTPEARVKANIKILLTTNNCWYFMPVQNGMGAPSLDFLCAYKGRMFAIEAKAPGKKPTLRQQGTMRAMEAHGIRCFVCDGNYKELEQWLTELYHTV